MSHELEEEQQELFTEIFLEEYLSRFNLEEKYEDTDPWEKPWDLDWCVELQGDNIQQMVNNYLDQYDGDMYDELKEMQQDCYRCSGCKSCLGTEW